MLYYKKGVLESNYLFNPVELEDSQLRQNSKKLLLELVYYLFY